MNTHKIFGFDSVRLTILVDNEVYLKGLSSTWGLSIYIEAERNGLQRKVLMDTSGAYDTLIYNSSKLRIDLSAVEAIFISHWHGDHCGCLKEVLEVLKPETPVYVPSYNRGGVKAIEKAGGKAVICSEPTSFLEGFLSTGCLGRWTKEHSLLIKLTNSEFILLTGCAHPGVINIVKHSQRLLGNLKLKAAIGGFHISGREEGIAVGEFMKQNKVEVVSPCHCTGDNAKIAIHEVLGDNYTRCGAGKIFQFKGKK